MRARSLLAMLGLFMSLPGAAQTPAPPSANTQPEYRQLRAVGLSGETIGIDDYVLRRDAGTFHFKNGSFYLLAPVGGKVTGAVFVGEGTFQVKPPLSSEEALLKQRTREAEFAEQFNTVVLRFTDRTYDELKSAGKSATGSAPAGASAALTETQEACQKKLHWNLAARILSDVLRERPGGLFTAFIKGKKYSGKLLYVIDPTGAPRVAPEEIALSSYEDGKEGIWTAFHYLSEYAMETATGTQDSAPLHVVAQKLETRLERGGFLRGNASTTFTASLAGLRMAPFELYKALRVQKVTGPNGEPLPFIQEDKLEDPDFWVILPKPLAKGEQLTITTAYEGKDAVREESGTYLPRDSWYPSSTGDYATYEMSFSVPKMLDLVASGERVNEEQRGDQRVSVWRSDAPLPGAAFVCGTFKREPGKAGLRYVLEAYANKEDPGWASPLKEATAQKQRGGIGSTPEFKVPKGVFSTVQLSREAVAQAENVMKVYDAYFGEMPYKHVAITQQAACKPGQAWSQILYLPMCAYLDSLQRSTANLDRDLRDYWADATAHEVAHQWWGNAVGVNSYRDRWMAEGFPVFAAGLYLQMSDPDPTIWLKYWNDWRDILVEKNKEGKSPNDAGPLTSAYRAGSSRPGFDLSQKLVNPKGGYILHMIRMMMFEERTGDQRFKEMMRDFVASHRNRPASTEDFKAAVEKYMTPAMNLSGDGSMNWFFNEYVYGTALPTYTLDYSFQPGAGGIVMKIKATQSNVDAQFAMPVPLYLDLGKDNIVRLGLLNMVGNATVEREIPLPLKIAPKRAVLNYYNDVLAGK